MRKITTVLFASFLLGAVGCRKETRDGSSLAFSLKAINPATALPGIAPAGVTGRLQEVNLQWTSATASATLLKFEATTGGSETEFKSTTSQTVDLFKAANLLGNVSIPAGTYSEVEFRANLGVVGGAPALLMNGTLQSGTSSIPVTFQAAENIEVKGEKHNVTISGSTGSSVLIPMDLSRIIAGISSTDFSNAVLTNGTLLITSSVNSNLYQKIVRNIRDLDDECEFHS